MNRKDRQLIEHLDTGGKDPLGVHFSHISRGAFVCVHFRAVVLNYFRT